MKPPTTTDYVATSLFSADSKSFAFASSHEFSLWTLKRGRQFLDPACTGPTMAVTTDWKSAAYPAARTKTDSDKRGFPKWIYKIRSLSIQMAHTTRTKTDSDERSFPKWTNKIRYLSIQTGVSVDFPEIDDEIKLLAISPDSKWIASVTGHQGELAIWPVDTRSRHVCCGHETRVTSIAFSSHSTMLASADKAGRILEIGRSLHTLSFSSDDVFLTTIFGNILVHRPAGAPSLEKSVSDDLDSEDASAVFRKPRWHGYGMDISGKWITWNGINIISLPTDVDASSKLNTPSYYSHGLQDGVAVGKSVVAWISPARELYALGFSHDMVPFDLI
ncbi:protein kinase subdomain-containing protein [Colletotrichum tofieldiae]|uniref:Protein kinase subdomain-containing protein n=1 Tax=Colletotrichum tofieldiae TaxID=708197 RepID=A0A166U6A8_9PEZI|nr:protein kinase subdomain-containing protein [Colletotrichum tofieldiae]